MAFPVQIVQIMERDEIAVVPIARGVTYLNDEFNITSVLGKLLEEFIEKLNVGAPLAATSKHFSMFITEIGDLSPDLAMQCLQSAEEILNLEVTISISCSYFKANFNLLSVQPAIRNTKQFIRCNG